MRSGIILAGGEGRRIGGAKALVELRGRPLVAYALDLMAKVADETIVAHGTTVDARLAAIVGGRATLVPDPGEGPLGALLAAAEKARGDWLVVAPVDAPFVTPEMFEELFAAVGSRDGACFAADGVPNPLVAVVRREKALEALDEARFRGKRGVKDAWAMIDVTLVQGAAHDLADVDTPDDLRRAEERAR